MRIATLVPFALIATACRSLPDEAADLVGYWERTGDGPAAYLAIGEGFATAEDPPLALAYDRYDEGEGGALILSQQGGLALAGDQLVWSIVWDTHNGDLAGAALRWEVKDASRRRFTAVEANGERTTWRRVDALPEAEPGLGSFGRFQSGSLFSKGYPYRMRPTADGGLAFHTDGIGEGPRLRKRDARGEQAYYLDTPGRVHDVIEDDHLITHAEPGVFLGRYTPAGEPVWALDLPGVTATDLDVLGDEAYVLLHTYGPFPAALALPDAPNQTNYAVLRVSVSTGESLGALWVGGGGGAPDLNKLLVLEEGAFVVLLPISGVQQTPEGPTGRAGANGLSMAVYEADGTLRWRRWLGPNATYFPRSLITGPDHQLLVAGGVRGRLNLGAGLVDATPYITGDSSQLLNNAFAVDARDGGLRWERYAFDDADDYGLLALASREDGHIAWVQSVSAPSDLGGAVGLVTPARGAELVVALLDGCGEALAAKVFVECDCTYEDPSGYVQAWEAVFDPSGALHLGLFFNGYYRFSGNPPGGSGTGVGDVGSVGESFAGIVTLDGPGRPAAPPTCPRPTLTEPRIALDIDGDGEVDAGPLGACDEDCSLSGNLFDTVTLSAAPEPGHRFAGWTGACEGIGACVINLDDDVTAVSARFEATIIDRVWPLTGGNNLAVVSPVLAVGANGDSLLAARVQGELSIAGDTVITDTAGLPGLVVALNAAGGVRWTARLDPPGQGGTSVVGLLGRADQGALVLTDSGRLLRFGPTGAVASGGPLPGLTGLTKLAEDDAGALAVVAAAQKTLTFAGVQPGATVDWTTQLESTGSVQIVDFVGLTSGFAGLFQWSGVLTLDGDVVLGTSGLGLITLGSSGALVEIAAVPAGAPSGIYGQTDGILQRGNDGGLWLIGDRTRDTSAPRDGVYAEPIATDATRRGAPVLARLPMWGANFGAAPMRPLRTGWGALGAIQFDADIEGFDLPHRGDADLVLGGVSASAVRSAESLGSPAADQWQRSASGGDRLLALGYFGAAGEVGGEVVGPGYVLLSARP